MFSIFKKVGEAVETIGKAKKRTMERIGITNNIAD
tara:strand:+ start:1048 stop:1152 length:105 start_codon:yes stop_codon:yes gene_type:complete